MVMVDFAVFDSVINSTHKQGTVNTYIEYDTLGGFETAGL